VRLEGFLEFLREWFRGFVGVGVYAKREFGLLIGDMAAKTGFERDSMVLGGFELVYWPRVKKRFNESNLFMGIGYWETGDTEPILENMYYERIAYDFDSEWSPQLAVEAAREFSRLLKETYGFDTVLVKSGFKGANVYIPLKTPVQWDEYQVLWKALLKLLPPEKSQLCDYNMLQWNRLARIPMTINYKSGERRWAWIIQPSVRGWLDFKWEGLEPLNPADLPVAKIKVAIPTLQRHFVEPVDDATPVSVEAQAPSTARKPRRYEWVEKIVEKGLPDGRKRFILYVLSAYLVNVKRLSEGEAIQVVQEFLDNSCRNHNNCGKVYESFIRGDLQRVKSKGLKPTTLEKLREKDPDLHSLIEQALQN
jgi:hypothetical protein